MKPQVEHSFSEFYNNWVWKLEEIHHQLVEVEDQDLQLQALVSEVTSHLKEYYTVKWAWAHQDVLPFFSPPWLTPLETAHSSWLTGWKPSSAFRLLHSLTAKKPTVFLAMTEEQRTKIEDLRMKVRTEEERVESEMERLQVAMADRKMVELAKRWSRRRHDDDGGEGGVEVAVKGVMAGLEKVMKAADCVRLKTLKATLDVLTPLQCVQFLAAILALHLRLRRWGNDNVHTPKLNE